MSSPRKLSEEPEDLGEPSLLEKKLYYYGLPTSPLLVARTGSTKWALPSNPHDHIPPKAMRNVGPSHRLVGIWESVLDEIMKALEPLAWTSIDLLRIGYQGTTEKDWPVTLMVGIAPSSNSWDVTSPVAVACRAILRARDVWDVECEIRQSGTFCCVSHRLITADEMVSRPEAEKAFSECVSQSISPCSEPSREGTLGIYLTVGAGGGVCALTCRHVVFGRLETESALKEAIRDTRCHRGVVQPCQKVLDALLTSETALALAEGDEPAFLKTISTQQKVEDRRIGHVFFSPARSIDGDCQLHDWLLVKLDATRYASLSALQNWAWVGRRGYVDMLLHLHNKAKPEKKAGSNMVRLKGVVSKAEIFQTTAHDEPTQDHAALWVHMVGARSGKLTTGISNEVRSVCRLKAAIDSSEIITTLEWCVVGRNGLDGSVLHGVDSQNTRLLPFSMAGDSGSAVFDSQGRIAGILTSGCGFMEDITQGTNNYFGYTDVSYVTPIEVILEVLKTKYGRAEIL